MLVIPGFQKNLAVDRLEMATCNNCAVLISDSVDRCTSCGMDVGFPNVRDAEKEQSALISRYEAVVESARQQGLYDNLLRFEEAAGKAFAVFNVELEDLDFLLSNDMRIYSTYRLQVSGETRKTANTENDRHRMMVEGAIFGSYGKNIRYASLSLDGNGLMSYGAYAIRLRDVS